MNNDLVLKDFDYVNINVCVDIQLIIDSSLNEEHTREIIQEHKSKITAMVEYEYRDYSCREDKYYITAGYDYFDFDNQEVKVYVSIEHFTNIDNPIEGESTLVHEGQERLDI